MSVQAQARHWAAGLVFLVGAAVAGIIGIRTLQSTRAIDRDLATLEMSAKSTPTELQRYARELRELEERRDRSQRTAYLLFFLTAGLVSGGLGLLRRRRARDPSELRATLRERSEGELLEAGVVDPAALEPEARLVYREELQERLGDLDAFLAGEKARMGEVLSRSEASIQFDRGRLGWTGTLILTTRGAGAICERGQSGNGGLLDRLSDERLPALPVPARRFPLPLLARIYQRVIWIEAPEIHQAERRSCELTVRGRDGERIQAPLSRDDWREWRERLPSKPAN